MLREDIKTVITMISQVIILYVIRPVFSRALRFLNWSAKNVCLFLCVLFFIVFYFERMGLSSDVVPDRIRDILTIQFALGWFTTPPVYIMMIGLLAFTMLLFVYIQVKNALREVIRTVKSIVSIFVLFIMYLYYRVRGTVNHEFVILESVFTVRTISKFLLILGIIFSPGLMVFAVHTIPQDAVDETLFGQLYNNTTYKNVTIVTVGNYQYNVTVEDGDLLPRTYPIYINLTTERTGYHMINVSHQIDTIFFAFDRKVNEYAIRH